MYVVWMDVSAQFGARALVAVLLAPLRRPVLAASLCAGSRRHRLASKPERVVEAFLCKVLQSATGSCFFLRGGLCLSEAYPPVQLCGSGWVEWQPPPAVARPAVHTPPRRYDMPTGFQIRAASCGCEGFAGPGLGLGLQKRRLNSVAPHKFQWTQTGRGPPVLAPARRKHRSELPTGRKKSRLVSQAYQCLVLYFTFGTCCPIARYVFNAIGRERLCWPSLTAAQPLIGATRRVCTNDIFKLVVLRISGSFHHVCPSR